MLLIVHQCFLMTISRKIIVFKPTLQTTNKFFSSKLSGQMAFGPGPGPPNYWLAKGDIRHLLVVACPPPHIIFCCIFVLSLMNNQNKTKQKLDNSPNESYYTTYTMGQKEKLRSTKWK